MPQLAWHQIRPSPQNPALLFFLYQTRPLLPYRSQLFESHRNPPWPVRLALLPYLYQILQLPQRLGSTPDWHQIQPQLVHPWPQSLLRPSLLQQPHLTLQFAQRRSLPMRQGPSYPIDRLRGLRRLLDQDLRFVHC